MSKSFHNFLILLLCLAGVLNACTHKTRTRKATPVQDTVAATIPTTPGNDISTEFDKPVITIDTVVVINQTPVVVADTLPLPTVSHSHWHTLQVYPLDITVRSRQGEMHFTGRVMSVRDSLTIVSLMLLPGIEAMRVEADPVYVTVIDRLTRRYTRASYDEIGAMAGMPVNLAMAETVAAGEILPEGKQELDIEEQGIRLHIRYTTVTKDEPLRIRTIDKTSFKSCTIQELLPF